MLPLNFKTKADRDSEDEPSEKEELEAIRANFTDKNMTFYDICTLEKFEDSDKLDDNGNLKVPLCNKGFNPLNFIYELDSGKYNLSRYENDGELLAKV
jgi:hypothetical protein